MQRTERGASLEMPFRVPRQVAISSERRSFEPAWVKRNHTDLHIMIYILVLCLLRSFASRRPRLPALDHALRARLLFCLFFHPSPSSLPSSSSTRPPFRSSCSWWTDGEITNSLFMGIVTNNRDIWEIWNNFFSGRLYRKESFSAWSRIRSPYSVIGIFIVRSMPMKSI